MHDIISVSPSKIISESSKKELGRGNLGVLIARAGVGKTVCLIHIAYDQIFHEKRLVHVSLEEGVEKVTSFYDSIYYDLVKSSNFTDDDMHRELIEKNRIILAFLNQSFDVERLCTGLKNISANLAFRPDTLIVDGIDFERADRALFERFKQIAEEFKMEVWFSALSHRHIDKVNKRGIPYPCHDFDDLFSLIIQLRSESDGIFLRLCKDHDGSILPETSFRLDPNTLLVIE